MCPPRCPFTTPPLRVEAALGVTSGETLYANPAQAVAVADAGKLFLKVLWPLEHNLRKVGGRGVKAFWVFDAQYDWNWDPNEPQPRPVTDFEPVPYGEWRLELEPADAALDHTFLTVLYPTATNTSTMPPAARVAADAMEGVCLQDPDNPWVILFAQSSTAPSLPITFSYEPRGVPRHLVIDLSPASRYAGSAVKTNGTMTVTLTADNAARYQADDQGVLLIEDADFDGLPNDWEIAWGLDPNDASGDNGATGDPDHDGVDNHAEFQAGTPPTGANPELRLFLPKTATLPPTIHWYGVAGRTYQVERSTNLVPGSWEVLIHHYPTVLPFNAYIDNNAASAGSYFYRVQLESER